MYFEHKVVPGAEDPFSNGTGTKDELLELLDGLGQEISEPIKSKTEKPAAIPPSPAPTSQPAPQAATPEIGAKTPPSVMTSSTPKKITTPAGTTQVTSKRAPMVLIISLLKFICSSCDFDISKLVASLSKIPREALPGLSQRLNVISPYLDIIDAPNVLPAEKKKAQTELDKLLGTSKKNELLKALYRFPISPISQTATIINILLK